MLTSSIVNTTTKICRIGSPVGDAAARRGRALAPCLNDLDCGNCGAGAAKGSCIPHRSRNPGLYPSVDVDRSKSLPRSDEEWMSSKLTAAQSICRMGAFVDGLSARQSDETKPWEVDPKHKFCAYDSLPQKVCQPCQSSADCRSSITGGGTVHGSCNSRKASSMTGGWPLN
jgi:hypothetical protein